MANRKLDASKIGTYWRKGAKDKFWYEDCQQTFEDIFGSENLDVVTKTFAATSINTSLKGNVTLFKRAYSEYMNGEPISNYLPNIQKQLRLIREGKPLSGDKINAFARAMSGDPKAVVVDIWLLRAFRMNRRYYRSGSQSVREGGATKKQFREIELWVREEAELLGVEPRQLSAMIWSGIRTLEGGDAQTRYTDLLRAEYVNSLFPTKFY